ncbi:vWA domain-containing protein [Actinokineospora inagensis]|uniref:vWA domain-containing protein n=1 Tax=Actinokineospora inagensis TaxID=103730 RepID=UPI0004294275|nr:vWA domain-containing protein [Actinokineospora inagensis]
MAALRLGVVGVLIAALVPGSAAVAQRATTVGMTISEPTEGAVVPPGAVPVRGTASIGDTTLPPDTGIVLVVDVSGSTDSVCGTRTTLGCEVAAGEGVIQQAVHEGSIGSVAVVAFGGDAKTADLSPPVSDSNPVDEYVRPGTDADHDNVYDTSTVLESLDNGTSGGIGKYTRFDVDSGYTRYPEAVTVAKRVAATMPEHNKLIIFMSDGQNNGGSVTDALDPVVDTIKFHTFAVGTAATCGTVSDSTTLGYIGDHTHGGCSEVGDATTLPDVVPNLVRSSLNSVSVSVDGGTERQISVPGLPHTGPYTTPYDTTVDLASGNHRVCVIARGKDVYGDGSAVQCRNVIVNAPPVVNAGGPYDGLQNADIPIAGTFTDSDGATQTTTWTVNPNSGECTVANPSALNTTVRCTTFGTYVLSLTGSDGVNGPVRNTAILHVRNAPPTVDAGGPYSGGQGTPVQITGTATDPDGPSLTTTWSVLPLQTGGPVPDCAIANPQALRTTITCNQHGTYTVVLTANDGVNEEVSDTTTVTFDNVPPKVDAGGPYTGQEDTAIPIKGTVADPDSPESKVTWSVDPQCSFTATDQLSTNITCADPGKYTLVLTVDDGVNPPVSARTVLTITKTPEPKGALSLSLTALPSPGYVGGLPVTVTYTVRNGGPVPMTGVRLTAPVPTGLVAGAPAGCPTACDLGTLAPGQSVQVQGAYLAGAAVDVPVTATVSTTGPDIDPNDNTATGRIVVKQPTLRVDPSAGPQGEVTNAYGTDFPPDATVRLSWDVGISELPGTVRVKPDGTFQSQVLVFHKDTLGPRALGADPAGGSPFGRVQATPYVVMIRSLQPVAFVLRGDPRTFILR